MNQNAGKGLHPLAWVAIGCGALLLIGVVVLAAGGFFVAKKVGEVVQNAEANPAQAAAELIVGLNPDLDLVESDSEAGKITIRNNKTNEQATFNFEDIAEGNFSFTTGEGEEFSIDASGAEQGEGIKVTTQESEMQLGGADVEMPSWLQVYPGASKPQSAYDVSSAGKRTGLASMESADEVETIVSYYEEKLKAEGYEVQVARISAGGSTQAVVTAESQDPKRTQIFTIGRKGETTTIGVQYEGQDE